MDSTLQDQVFHEARERHFRIVSKAFFTVSVLAFIAAGVSLGKDAKVQATSLHLKPVNQVSRAIPQIAQTQGRASALRAERPLEGHIDEQLQLTAPLLEPTSVQPSNQSLAGGFLGAMTLIGGLFYVFQRQKDQPSGPTTVGPIPNYAMVSAAGEDDGLLKKPTAPGLLNKPSVKASETPAYVTVEYQRKQAKALFEHFDNLEQAALAKDSRKLGWTASNEITNGRWVMFGWLVGMMTEYATGVSFVEQIKLTLNNLAIIDLD